MSRLFLDLLFNKRRLGKGKRVAKKIREAERVFKILLGSVYVSDRNLERKIQNVNNPQQFRMKLAKNAARLG